MVRKNACALRRYERDLGKGEDFLNQQESLVIEMNTKYHVAKGLYRVNE